MHAERDSRGHEAANEADSPHDFRRQRLFDGSTRSDAGASDSSPAHRTMHAHRFIVATSHSWRSPKAHETSRLDKAADAHQNDARRALDHLRAGQKLRGLCVTRDPEIRMIAARRQRLETRMPAA